MKGDEKKCPFCAEIIKRDATVCRFCDKPVAGTASGKVKGGQAGMLVGLLVLFGLAAYIYWSPYETLHEIRKELRNGQADKLDQVIDYTAVREGLKRDFRALALGEVEDDPSIKNKLLGALGLALGAPVVDPIVDYIVSPAGLRDVVSGAVPVLSQHRGLSDDADLDSPSAPASTVPPKDSIKKTDGHYTDINEFIAIISSKSGSATKLTFSRKGLVSWQLTHIKLMPGHD
jgi:hypothetical protein